MFVALRCKIKKFIPLQRLYMEFNEIYCGDCLELIKQVPDHSIDTVITDPPYGIDFQSGMRKRKLDKIANDKVPFIEFIQHIPRVIKKTGAVYIFTRWDVQQVVIDEMEDCGLDVKNVIIWDKKQIGMGDLVRGYGYSYESICFSPQADFVFQEGRPRDLISVAREPNVIHPNQKPVNIIRYLIRQSTPRGGVVLDFTCGSGTTCVAAAMEKRRYLGFELDPKYWKMSKDRVHIIESQPTLF